MKLDRTLFPPLTEEDYLCEYYYTKETMRDYIELLKLPPHAWPPSFGIKIKGLKKARKPDVK